MEGLRLKIACQGGGGATDKNRQERGKAISLQLWGGVEEVRGEGKFEAFSAVMFLHCISQSSPVNQTVWAGLRTMYYTIQLVAMLVWRCGRQ